MELKPIIYVPIIHIFITILATILAIFSYTNFETKNAEFLVDIGKNLSQGTIQTIIPSSGECFDTNKILFNQEWPGTNKGCDCFEGFIRTSLCNKNKIKRLTGLGTGSGTSINCLPVGEIGPVVFSSWGGSRLCGSRISSSYLDLILKSSEDQCPQGTRSCGIADTLMQIMCLDNQLSCPINKVVIINSMPELPKDFNYITQFLSNGKIIAYINENVKGAIIQELVISDKIPCLNSGFVNLNNQPIAIEKNYPLFGCPELKSGKKFDERTELIDTDSTVTVMDYNEILSKLKGLPYYTPPSNFETTGLYARSYYGLKEECRKKIKDKGIDMFLKTLENLEEDVSSIKKIAIPLFVFSILYCMIAAFIFSIFICSAKHGRGVIGHYSVFYFYAIFGVLLFGLSISITIKSFIIPTYYNIFSDKDCSDSFTSEIVKDFSQNINIAKYFSLVVSILSLFLSLYGLLNYKIVFSNEDSQKSNN